MVITERQSAAWQGIAHEDTKTKTHSDLNWGRYSEWWPHQSAAKFKTRACHACFAKGIIACLSTPEHLLLLRWVQPSHGNMLSGPPSGTLLQSLLRQLGAARTWRIMEAQNTEKGH